MAYGSQQLMSKCTKQTEALYYSHLSPAGENFSL